MEFEDPGYSDEDIVEFEKIAAVNDEQRKKLKQLLSLVFGGPKFWN